MVRGRLAEDLPLGYSAAGRVISVGEFVDGIRVGDLVATGGAGWANHAEFQAVPGRLCSVVPPGVSAEEAAFSTIASIALHAFRLANVEVGSKVVVQGAGLLGQLAVRIASAAGADALAIDISQNAVDGATSRGIPSLTDDGAATTNEILSWTRGRGADAVLVCAAGSSDEIVGRVPELCRDRANVVVVGDVGLGLNRTPFYQKELTLTFARSYGPGRYQREYEEWGVDLPVGHVRWTEGRNLEAILDLLQREALTVSDLITHRFSIESADEAYAMIDQGSDTYVAIAIEYPSTPQALPVSNSASSSFDAQNVSNHSPLAVGWLGAGNFSKGTLLPAFQSAGFDDFIAIASTRGVSAAQMATASNFKSTAAKNSDIIHDPQIGTVVIATQHDTHSQLVAQALRAGKNVWCEKPLALSEEEMLRVMEALPSGGILAVGFNRRFSPAVKSVARALPRAGSISITYRVAAGAIPDDHWYNDRRQGGRLLGEACHFVDTASAIIGDNPVEVTAIGGERNRATLLDDNFSITLRYPNGSLATILYSSASGRWGKEYVEILAGDTRAVIDDFRSAKVNSRTVWKGSQDKGHQAAVRAFKEDILRGSSETTEASLSTSWATLAAAASLLS